MAVIRGLAVLSGLLLADSQPVTSNNPTVPLCVTCRHEKISVCNARCRKGIFIVYGSLTPIYSNYSFRIFNRKCLCRFGIAISPLFIRPRGLYKVCRKNSCSNNQKLLLLLSNLRDDNDRHFQWCCYEHYLQRHNTL